ncbi:hypothetical protein CYMTET_56466 [Cymbomonas tetramitiformis]|uniref:Reverse transcriptase domain-containing protein n=1 Tax=Cymbomonas tetramitiformis TaxID=36881 RepID=A0AAE0ELT4_9CHLO|nr:hypothetical protein CYMTET_56466 [Cymbomonas tetramitiformis]
MTSHHWGHQRLRQDLLLSAHDPERAITRAELEARCRHRTCPLEGGRRSDLASLAPAVQAASERMLEQLYEEPNPWKGGHARWVTENQVAGDRPSLDAPPSYNWANQRLYLDRHHIARLCRILQDPAQDMPTRPSQDHVCVEFARCREQKWVTVDQLMSPNWLHVDQKLDHDEEKDRWMLDGDYMTHVPSSASKQDVVKPRERGRSRLDLNPIQKLQDKLQALFKYPSGEVTGTLMWDLKERVLCVQPSAATQYLDLMSCTLDHALVHNGEELLDELQLPHWYESTGVWAYQLLRYLCPVDMESLSDGILRQYGRHGHKGPPLEIVSLDSNTKYYPVGDGLGGPGRVFSENAAAQEYVRLGEMRKMLKSVNTKQQGYDALDADAERRPPPCNDMASTRLTKQALTQPPAPAAGAGPSQAAAGPSQAAAGPSRAAAGPSRAAAGPSRARSISRSPPRISDIAYRATPSPSSSDIGPANNSHRDAVQMATSSVSSVGRFLSVEEVRALKDRRNLTVFMVKFGLTLRKYPGITSKVAKKHDKTIHCGRQGWRLPLGGQTTSSNLLEAIMSAYADLSHRSSGHRREGGHARNIENSLCSYVGLGSAHVLRCMAHPNATPVFYIFMEDQRCLSWRAEFTNEYLMRDDRKFTCLQWGTREVAAPWLLPALGALEARRLPPPPPAHQARVAERPEHMDTIWARNVDEDAGRPRLTASSFSGAFGVQRGSPLEARCPAGVYLACRQCSGLVVAGTRSRAYGRRLGDVGGDGVALDMCAAALLLVVLAWLWVCASIYTEDVAHRASYVVDNPLDAGHIRRDRGWTVPSLRWSQVFLLGRVCLPALPARLDKPRFAARWAQLRRNLQLHRVAQAAYMALVLTLVVSTAAGGSTRLAHGGWRVMACFFASNSPAAAVHFNRILRFFLLLCGILWVAGKLTESVPAYDVMSPTRSAWGASPCTSWEAQQSSRQWEPGWEANVAEQDEVLPYTVLDELQPLGDTTVTKDEAAWLDTELNATFGGHPDFKEEHWEEMRNVLRRCKTTFANSPHDLTGYKGKAEHNTFSIPFIDESKAAYQRPRKYSPGEQEIIDIHCKELLEGVNRHSLKDNTLPHRPEELYQKVAKAKFKTTLDATKAFHQIPMATEEDRSKTAFWWKNQLYQYTSMPFGAAGATSAFVRIMDYELRHLQHCTVAYVDDVVVYTDSTPEQHLKDVEDVLRTLGDAGIRLHAGKSTFGSSSRKLGRKVWCATSHVEASVLA